MLRILTQLKLILTSRAFFVLLYGVFLWSLAVALASTFSMRVSIPNLVQNFAPALIIGAVALGYWFYMIQIKASGVTVSLKRPLLSPSLLLVLILTSSLGAIFVALTGNRITSSAGIMEVMLYILGLFGVVVLSALKPYLGICAMLLALPVALLYHLNVRFQGFNDSFSYIVMNPEILLVLATLLSIQVGNLVRHSPPVRTRLDIQIAVFLIGTLFALLNSTDFLFSSRVVFAGTLVPILSYYTIVSGLRTRREYFIVISVFLLSFFLMGSYSIMGFVRDIPTEALFSGQDRLTGFFLNPGFFAILLTLVLPLPVTLAASSAVSFKVRSVSAVLAIILLLAMIFTFTRGAWLGSAVSLATLILISSEVRRMLLKTSPMILLVLVIGWSLLSELFWVRTESLEIFLQSPSWTDRLIAWESAWQMIISNPVTGVGPGLFGVFYPDYEVAYLRFAQSNGMNAHSLLLNVWAETGLLAAAGLIWLFVSCLWTGYSFIRSGKDSLMRVVVGGLVAGLLGYLVNVSTHGAMMTKVMLDRESFFAGFTFYTFIVLGLIVASHRIQEKAEPPDGIGLETQ